MSAFYTKHLLDPVTRTTFLRAAPHGVARLRRIGDAGPDMQARQDVPVRRLLLRELAGMGTGPLLYWAARHATLRGGA